MKKIITFTIILFLLVGGGYKIVNQSELYKFSVSNINLEGDKKVNYLIKNKILSTDLNNRNNLIELDLRTKKMKNIKEKNIKNEITKYQLIITVNIKLNSNKITNIKEFTLNEIGTYNVENQHTQTLSNEKKLIILLSNNLAEKILEEISLRLNDL